MKIIIEINNFTHSQITNNENNKALNNNNKLNWNNQKNLKKKENNLLDSSKLKTEVNKNNENNLNK